MAVFARILAKSAEQTGGKVAANARFWQGGLGVQEREGLETKEKKTRGGEAGPKPGQEDWATGHNRSRVGDVASPSTPLKMWPDRMDGGSFINGCQSRRIGYLSPSPSSLSSFRRSPDKAGAVKIRKGDIKSVAQGFPTISISPLPFKW